MAKALSVQQPWAWLIVNGYKDIENRDWPTRFRGPLFIHAGKKYDALGEAWIRRNFPELRLPERVAMEMGGIVGAVRVLDCVRQSRSPWFQGEYGFVLAHGTPLPFRAVRGMLGFFDVPEPVRALSTGDAAE
jgi:hypothetical protein